MTILFDQFNLPDSIYEIVFATDQQILVAQMLVEHMKQHDNEIGKTEMSMFATALHDGTLVDTDDESLAIEEEEEVSYNKRQFYDRILTPMKTMGMIDYDNYKKTYKLSEQFNKNMMKIGLMWMEEMRNPPLQFELVDKES